MDASDLADIGAAVAEFFDQTCTITRHDAVIGSFPCLLLPMGAAGGVTGMSPDPNDAEAAGLGTWRAFLPIEAEFAAAAGSRLIGSRGLDLAIVGTDAGRSLPGFTTISAAKQEAATPPVLLVLERWNPATLTWTTLPPQEFQTLMRNVQDVGTPPYGFERQQGTITLLGALDADIEVEDRFAWEDGAGVVTHVTRSDRTEAVGTVRWT